MRLAGLLSIVVASTIAAAEPKPPPRPKDEALKLFVDELVPITPGKGKFPAAFRMGSDGESPATEKPAREVKLRAPFAIAKYEVTQELYQAVMGKNPSKWTGPRNSVEMVSWDEAVEFCWKATVELRERKLIAPDEVIRLPSEAEWEYACRGGTTTKYSFGDAAADLKDHGWYDGNAKGEDPPVGKKKPNPWGLYDMHGYIWEWCQDAWQPSYEGAPADGKAREAKDLKERVIRGGSWADNAERARSAFRGHAEAGQRSDAIGFRCVRAKE